jgi:hypothetical protein
MSVLLGDKTIVDPYNACLDVVSTAGFRDLNSNLILPCGHIAEVQIHHRGIKAFEKQHHSHDHVSSEPP